MENLNDYKSAYTPDFQFFEENIWYLTHYAKVMCASIHEHKFESILSLGIGHNIVINALQNEFDHSVKEHLILDGSRDLIESFKRNNPECKSRFKEIYFEDFVPEKKYDAIEMGFVLEHVDDPAAIVQQFKEYLKPGGILYVTVPNARSLHRLIGYKANLLDDLYALSKADYELGHKRYFDLNSIQELVSNAGFTISKTMGLMLKPITGAQIKTLGWTKDVIDALFSIGEDYPEISNCIYLEANS